jgi:hypothetical protein
MIVGMYRSSLWVTVFPMCCWRKPVLFVRYRHGHTERASTINLLLELAEGPRKGSEDKIRLRNVNSDHQLYGWEV